MQAEDRIIHFSAELLHRPVPPKKDALQKLYFELSQTRTGSYDSTDFSNMVQPRFYSRRGKKTQSVALFLPDRLLLIEEWSDLPLSGFLDRVLEVGSRTLEARGVPKYVAHTATIRSTFALTHYDDARVFLLDHVCGQENRIGPYFQRPIATGGLRFVLPETDEHPGTLHLLVESFRHSKNEIFVEAKGVFGRQQLDAAEMDVMMQNMQAVRSFISGPIYGYLNQFDEPRDLPE